MSCLGTTRAAAGSTKNQERIDLDLNRELAQKAKHDGVDTVSRRARGGGEGEGIGGGEGGGEGAWKKGIPLIDVICLV